MGRFLVTGAAGFIGYHLACSLAEDGHDLVIIDNFYRGERDLRFGELAARSNVRLLVGDLTQLSVLETITGDFEVCFHMAALNGTQNFYEQPWPVVWNSTAPTLNLLQTLVRQGRCGTFVYAGSSESYAGTVTGFGWPVPTAENVPLTVLDIQTPRWSYAASKLHGEVATVNACRGVATDYLILRYHNTYGPRMGDRHVIPDFFLRALQGEFYIYGPEQTRSFLYIDDAVHVTRRLAEIPQAKNEIINVGGGEEITIGALADQMMHALGRSDPIEVRGAPLDSVARRAPDLTKLAYLVPGYAKIPLEEGLRRTLDYYESAMSQFAGRDTGFASSATREDQSYQLSKDNIAMNRLVGAGETKPETP
jgi:nucleoside-diphosphate-sugar epimerase